jgi:6-phosphogluconolactonase/glucosamine-6-phosphate isomerase/deaminase
VRWSGTRRPSWTRAPEPRGIALHRAEGSLDLGHLTCFALDEYAGLAPQHPRSYAAYLDREVVRPFGLSPEQVRVPDASRADLGGAAEEHERAIAAAVEGPVAARCPASVLQFHPGPRWSSTRPPRAG